MHTLILHQSNGIMGPPVRTVFTDEDSVLEAHQKVSGRDALRCSSSNLARSQDEEFRETYVSTSCYWADSYNRQKVIY
jgi:hypothetical protein